MNSPQTDGEPKRERENRFPTQRLLDVTINPIVVLDGERILDASNAAARLFRCPKSELNQIQLTDLVDEECRPSVRQVLRSGLDEPIQVTGVRRNGDTFPLEIAGVHAAFIHD